MVLVVTLNHGVLNDVDAYYIMHSVTALAFGWLNGQPVYVSENRFKRNISHENNSLFHRIPHFSSRQVRLQKMPLPGQVKEFV